MKDCGYCFETSENIAYIEKMTALFWEEEATYHEWESTYYSRKGWTPPPGETFFSTGTKIKELPPKERKELIKNDN